MILVLSFDSYEQGTDPVIDWLLYYKADFVRVSLSDLVTRRIPYTLDLHNQDCLINGMSVQKNIGVVWHRRFMGELNRYRYQSEPWSEQLTTEVRTEIKDLSEYLSTVFQEKTWLMPFQAIKVNKLTMLRLAHVCGLQIPQSKVINNKADLQRFFESCGNGLISKPISDSRKTYLYNGDTYLILTNEITQERIDQLPAQFFPSLFQEKIQVDFEIRVFYLDGQLYPTAFIIDTATKSVDKKMDVSATHMVPYQLPAEVEENIRQFMQKAALNTGCLDIIKDTNDQYVFIEVNPVGQYLAESEKCNYKLDKVIAEWLITHDQP